MKIDPIKDHRSNNFDTLRILAAFSVMISHSFALEGNPAEPLFIATDGQLSIGDLAVLIFFAISGFLIAKSYDRSHSAFYFVLARCLRILPALIAVLFISAFVIAPFLATLPVSEYFSNKHIYGYVIGNALMWFHPSLPGVFETLPYPNAVNGSLWTLSPEIECYLAVLFLGLTKQLRGWLTSVLALASAFAALAFQKTGSRVGLYDMFGCFAAGATIYLWHVTLDWRAAIACACVFVAAIPMKHLAGVAGFALSYVVMFVALSPGIRLPQLAARGDISYGLYIWAFFVQQLVATTLIPNGRWWINLLISAPITIAVAYMSWLMIEKPSLSFKYRLRHLKSATTSKPPVVGRAS
jgi:peptidoglycan/LPS O-acetylase OafA/YrhL